MSHSLKQIVDILKKYLLIWCESEGGKQEYCLFVTSEREIPVTIDIKSWSI